jgi:hypothetical protein
MLFAPSNVMTIVATVVVPLIKVISPGCGGVAARL